MLDPDWIPIKAAAEMCGVCPKFLYERRRKGGGPPWHKRGKKIIYRESEIATWIGQQRHAA